MLENLIRREDGLAPRLHFRIVMPAHIGDVVNGGDQPSQAFVVLRAGFPAIRQLLGAGAKFVGTQALQLLAFAEKNAEVRPEELVAGARQEIAINSADVNRPMRRVM